MIIKSMSRKVPSFGQLIAYISDIEKSDEQYNVYQNIFSRKAEDVEQEFQQNAKFMAKRKNGVYFYHEILSITKNEKLDEKQQKEVLRKIAYEYAYRRAERNLVLGTLHDDHDDHLHYHMMISANAVGESRKTRLSKAEFDKFKKQMEKWVLSKYPELKQKEVINRQAGEKLSNKGAERKRRTGKTPQRDLLKSKLQKIFETSTNRDEFFASLSKEKLEFYTRGKTIGVKDLATDRPHRLKTLGVLDCFNVMSERINLNESATKQQQEASEEKPSESEKKNSQKLSRTEKIKAERKKGLENSRRKQTSNEQKSSKGRNK